MNGVRRQYVEMSEKVTEYVCNMCVCVYMSMYVRPCM